MIASSPMVPIACLTHWYISMMFVVPVIAVIGWSWMSTRRHDRRKGGDPPAAQTQRSAGISG